MFRPCIDLHEGKVKQLVGGTLGDAGRPRTNFVSEKPAAWFAGLYQRDGLAGGHVIMLGPGNETEARAALAAFPGGLQIGGGINPDNARGWLDAGASHVIVTSWVFREGLVDWGRLGGLVQAVGRNRLVLDLSCRRRGEEYFVVTDRWQKFTELAISQDTLQKLAGSCAEFLVHAVDVEGLCHGIDRELAGKLGEWTTIPTTYAGGAKSMADLEEVTRLGQGRIDLTIGSALDIFGGSGVRYADAVAFNHKHATKRKMNFNAFWKWLQEERRTVENLGGMGKFEIEAQSDGGICTPQSTKKPHPFKKDDAEQVWKRFHDLPKNERLMAGHYVDGPQPHNMNPCPNRICCPWIAAAIRDFCAGVP